MAGADIVWITPEEYKRRGEIFEREAASIRDADGNPYVIPEGASNALGAWGYIRASEELASDIMDLPGGADQATTIIVAAGSGGTSAGLILGTWILGMKARVVNINVSDDEAYFSGD